MKTNLLLLLLVGLAANACDVGAPTQVTAPKESPPPNADDTSIKEVIARTFEDRLVMQFPIGKVQITSRLALNPFYNNPSKNWFESGFEKDLKEMEAEGLVTLHEHPEIGSEGQTLWTVTPTERLTTVADPTLSTANATVIRIGTCQVTQVIRTAPYQASNLPPSEEHKFVLGTLRVTPTKQMLSVSPETKPYDLKFRAIVSLNPFTRKYAFNKIDVGDPQKDEWKSNNIQ